MSKSPYQSILVAACALASGSLLAQGGPPPLPPPLQPPIAPAGNPVTTAKANLGKALFWDEDDCVIQYHPPRSEYVNNHQNCLHLWRPIGV